MTPTLPELCSSKELTEAELDEYIKNSYNGDSSRALNEPDDVKNMTPLGAACASGQIGNVRLLLKRGADVNKGHPKNRTPLWYATSKCPRTNRGVIVQALLADPRLSSLDTPATDAAGNTPLINAIDAVGDRDVVRLLVDKGADVQKKNAKGKSAAALARGTDLADELQGTTGILARLASIIFQVLALITHIIAWVNNRRQVETYEGMEGAVKGFYGLSGQEAPSTNAEQKKAEAIVEQVIGEPEGPSEMQEMQNKLDSYIQKSGLETFFAPGDNFIQEIATKAYNLSNDPADTLNTPDGITRLTQLALYQTVIYCDDSSSMDDTKNSPTRYENMCTIVERIARIATKLAPNGSGVHLRFINSSSQTKSTAEEIMAAMKDVKPRGKTPLGNGMYHKVLKPLVHDVVQSGKLERPLLICVITDGSPDNNDKPTFQQAITACKDELNKKEYPLTAVRYLISQIGNDPKAKNFLQLLEKDEKLKGILYCMTDSGNLDATFTELRENERSLDMWLLKTLTAPLLANEEIGNS